MNTEEKKGVVVMDEDSKKFYGLFGYVVVHIGASKENQANAMGKRVRKLYEENSSSIDCTIALVPKAASQGYLHKKIRLMRHWDIPSNYNYYGRI